jgi:hypothetical protein
VQLCLTGKFDRLQALVAARGLTPDGCHLRNTVSGLRKRTATMSQYECCPAVLRGPALSWMQLCGLTNIGASAQVLRD